MSLPLGVRGQALSGFSRTVLGRITRSPLPAAERGDFVLLFDASNGYDVAGYAGAMTTERLPGEAAVALRETGTPVVHNLPSIDHLEDGDVVALNPGGYVRTLYRLSSPHNALFATDRCNSWCLMCSQPPKARDDSDRIGEHLRLLELMAPGPRELGITGGEPSLFKADLIRIVRRCQELLPDTAVHILSNGRLFYYGSFARDLAAVEHPDLMLGIPLYSDVDSEHDFVVQARGAFHQTMIGFQNLGRFRVPVEVRVVVHRLTYRRLPSLAEFIYRNLPFAAHVALMGLEIMGFSIPNLDELWIDPFDYQEELREATLFLAARGMRVSIYNHQLCVVPRDIWSFCRKSISDWKNEYLPVCRGCEQQDRCGGFFASAVQRRHSLHIQPPAEPAREPAGPSGQ